MGERERREKYHSLARLNHGSRVAEPQRLSRCRKVLRTSLLAVAESVDHLPVAGANLEKGRAKLRRLAHK